MEGVTKFCEDLGVDPTDIVVVRTPLTLLLLLALPAPYDLVNDRDVHPR